MSTGGSIQEVSIRGRIFSVAADADSNRRLGGYENEQQMNGDGSSRTIKTKVGWRVDGLSLSVDDLRGDHEFLQEVADSTEHVDVTVKYASGAIWGGKGTITGEVQYASQNTTLPIVLEGPGKLTQQ